MPVPVCWTEVCVWGGVGGWGFGVGVGRLPPRKGMRYLE